MTLHHEVGLHNERKNKQSLRELQDKQLLLKANNEVFDDISGFVFSLEQTMET